MPITLSYSIPNDLAQLHDELLAAGLAPERVEGTGEAIVLTLPDGTVEAEVDAVVDAHTPRVRYDPAALLAQRAGALAANRRQALLARAARATTLAEVRDALVAHLRAEEEEG